MNSSISIFFSNQMSEGVIIEQKKWTNEGTVTKLDLVKAIYESVYDSGDGPDKSCGLDGDAYSSLLYVYPYDRDLIFQIGLTWGDLGVGTFSEVTVTENVPFSFTDSEDTTYPIQELLSKDFITDPWDNEGSELSNVRITVDGNTVSLSRPVYGTVKVVYKTVRYTYSLSIPPREDTVDTAFQSVAYAWWDGGVKLKELEAPPGAEYDYAAESRCWERGQLTVDPDSKPPELPEGEPDNDYVTIDYCSQERVDI